MNQSNKVYLELLIKSGVHFFQKNQPNIYYNQDNNIEKSKINFSLNIVKNIDELINSINSFHTFQ